MKKVKNSIFRMFRIKEKAEEAEEEREIKDDESNHLRKSCSLNLRLQYTRIIITSLTKVGFKSCILLDSSFQKFTNYQQ